MTMKTLKVEYKVKPSKLEVTLPVIQSFIKEAQADTEHVELYVGYRYKNDKTKFVHIMKFTNLENEKAHSSAKYTARFVEKLYPNCEVKPHFEEILEQ